MPLPSKLWRGSNRAAMVLAVSFRVIAALSVRTECQKNIFATMPQTPQTSQSAMIVFPAFDTNFKSRKRNFRCCAQCRSKRKKCELSSDSLKKGCVRCAHHGHECSLATQTAQSRTDENPLPFLGLYSPASSTQAFDPTPEISQLQFLPLAVADRALQTNLTPNYTPVSQPDGTFVEQNVPKSFIEKESIYESLAGYNIDLSPETFSFELLKSHFGYSAPSLFGNLGHAYSSRSDPSSYVLGDLIFQHSSGKKPTFATNRHFMMVSAQRKTNPPLRASLQFLRLIYAFTISSPSYHFELRQLKRLYEIYFFKINSIMPIVSELKFWELYEDKSNSTLVSLAIILAVLKDNLAKPILKRVFWRGQRKLNLISSLFEDFSEQQYFTCLKAFHQDIEAKIRHSLLAFDAYPEITSVAKLSVHLLLSLSCGFGKIGGVTCASDIDKAIAIALSMHLHIVKRNIDISDEGGIAEESRTFCSQLFWCCWLFDRFNAMINNRLIVIKDEDFNLEPPYKHMNLLRLIEVIRSYERMCIYVYQPGYPQKVAEFTDVGFRPPLHFDLAEFEATEFEFCDNEIANNSQVYTSFLSPDDFKRSSSTYVSNTIHFLTRIINNTTIAIAQELKFRDPNVSNDLARLCMTKASTNILWYSKKLHDDYKMNIPIIPFILMVALGCSLSRYTHTKVPTSNCSHMELFNFPDYFKELKKYRVHWATVDELCFLLESHFQYHGKNEIKNVRRNCDKSQVVDGSCFSTNTLTQGPEPAAPIRNIIHLNDDHSQGNETNRLKDVFVDDLNLFLENELFFNCLFRNYGNE